MSASARYRASCERLALACRRRLTPGLRYSQTTYEEALNAAVTPGIRWLDLGCGHQCLPEWRSASEATLFGRAATVVGVDRDLPAMAKHRNLSWRVGADIGRLPFADGSFDLVSANMVVEHLSAPEQQFREVERVLAPGGAFVFHTGNIWGYYILCSRLMPEFAKQRLAKLLQGREAEDVYPTHYRANSRRRILRLADGAGLQPQQLLLFATTPQTTFLPPMLPLELLWIRATMLRSLAGLRTNLIAVLRKPSGVSRSESWLAPYAEVAR